MSRALAFSALSCLAVQYGQDLESSMNDEQDPVSVPVQQMIVSNKVSEAAAASPSKADEASVTASEPADSKSPPQTHTASVTASAASSQLPAAPKPTPAETAAAAAAAVAAVPASAANTKKWQAVITDRWVPYKQVNDLAIFHLSDPKP
jgi:hypothetical protein